MILTKTEAVLLPEEIITTTEEEDLHLLYMHRAGMTPTSRIDLSP
jgi:hypothetical protein